MPLELPEAELVPERASAQPAAEAQRVRSASGLLVPGPQAARQETAWAQPPALVRQEGWEQPHHLLPALQAEKPGGHSPEPQALGQSQRRPRFAPPGRPGPVLVFRSWVLLLPCLLLLLRGHG